MNTIDQDAPSGRRKRRRYTDEFKAEVVAVCQGPGVSVAAIALMHKLNANLLRHWLEKAESITLDTLNVDVDTAFKCKQPVKAPCATRAESMERLRQVSIDEAATRRCQWRVVLAGA